MIIRLKKSILCLTRRKDMELINFKIWKEPSWKKHGTARSQQRGIKCSAAKVVFNYADREIEAGDGCIKLRISKSCLAGLVKEKLIKAKLAEKCKNLTIVTDGLSIITVYRSAN